MSDITIWHNPRCSKSRGACTILRDEGVAYEERRYLEEAPTRAELEQVMGLLGIDDPRQMMRTGEDAYVELGLGDPGLSRDRLLDAMVEHPILIERPIVVRGGRAVIARPPERVRELLG